MKKILFSGTGFPGGIKTLQTLQDNTLNVVQGLARQHENYTVLYGMEVNGAGTIISAGAFVYNGEIIPFVESTVGNKISIYEVIENDNFNTNPTNSTSIENLPAYSYKSAQTGTGGVHSFDTSQLKRYTNQLIIDKGVTIGVRNEDFSETVIVCNHKLLTQDEINNSMIIYTLTKENDMMSTVGGAKHFLLRRSTDNFTISHNLNLAPLEKPKITWQIVKM